MVVSLMYGMIHERIIIILIVAKAGMKDVHHLNLLVAIIIVLSIIIDAHQMISNLEIASIEIAAIINLVATIKVQTPIK